MPAIKLLSKQLANLIAAGEVVDRPASAAKELIENSIDAGATTITVEIAGGGNVMLKVTDDGCGIPSEELELAFARHATSKISSEADLESIYTMGFRGEALAAIAAVSNIDMYSKTREQPIGRHIRLEAGTVVINEEAGCPDGTTVIVRDLFFNTPARQKFIKKDSTEAGYIATVCQRAAMARPSIAFKYISNGLTEMQTMGDGKLYSVLYCLYGKELCSNLLPVEKEHDGIIVKGFVTKPTAARGSRSMQNFIVEGRPIKNLTIQAALEEAYKGRSMVGKFPAAFLSIELDPKFLDVNVHPTKQEVRFAAERRVFEAVYYGVKTALEKYYKPDEIRLSTPEKPVLPQKEQEIPAEQKNKAQPIVYKNDNNSTVGHGIISYAELGILNKRYEPAPIQKFNDSQIFIKDEIPAVQPLPVQIQVEEKKEPRPWRLIGETMGVYILVEQEDKLVIIDKHAAHERIIYERLKAENDRMPSQQLLEPVAVKLSPTECDAILENTDLLLKTGFAVEDFGGNCILVREIPEYIESGETSALLSDIANRLLTGKEVKSETLDSLLHMIACKSAVRSGDRATNEELLRLVADVLENENIRYCPHGRPIMTTLSMQELEKQFRRQL